MLYKFWKKFMIRYILEDPTTCEHEWEVYGTAINQMDLELQCSKCALTGAVKDPCQEEWDRAYDADQNPYIWKEKERVEIGTYQMI